MSGSIDIDAFDGRSSRRERRRASIHPAVRARTSRPRPILRHSSLCHLTTGAEMERPGLPGPAKSPQLFAKTGCSLSGSTERAERRRRARPRLKIGSATGLARHRSCLAVDRREPMSREPRRMLIRFGSSAAKARGGRLTHRGCDADDLARKAYRRVMPTPAHRNVRPSCRCSSPPGVS